MTEFSRRFILGGIAAGMAGAAMAEAPVRSARPVARTASAGASSTLTLAVPQGDARGVIAAANLSGQVACVVADARTGQVLEAVNGDLAMPPASVAKTVTSLYALETLGPSFRFSTRLIATGPVQGGQLRGDLVLAGGGDPTLDTDALAGMANALRSAGVTEISGRFLVWGASLPFTRAIAPDQPDYLGYNPAVSGVNLNYNRVHCEWKRTGADYAFTMDARSNRVVPPVSIARVSVAERDLPVFTYSDKGEYERWTIARSALGNAGARWLPVRRPELYAADVLRTLARGQGVNLPAAEITRNLPDGTVLAQRNSDPLPDVLRDMLKFSTNITAEAVGMTATARRGLLRDHDGSGPSMTAWLQNRIGAGSERFVDHSGLGASSRIAPADLVEALRRLGPKQWLRPLLRDFDMRDATGRATKNSPLRPQAKTGTLNFTSTLAGYVTAPGGRELVFAIFTGDPARRAAVPENQREMAPGSAGWVQRSKLLQSRLIERWGALYGA